jgi:hypothetical protein
MAWIESHQELANHPKVYRLADTLNVEVPTVIGYLHLWWWWCMAYADDGDLKGFTDGEIARAAQWSGDPSEFVKALVKVGWMDRGRHVHDWWEYAGKLVERRRTDAARKRAGRALDIQGTSDGHPVDVSRTQPNPTVRTPLPPKPDRKRERVKKNPDADLDEWANQEDT